MGASPYRYGVQANLPVLYPPAPAASTLPNPERYVGLAAWIVSLVQARWWLEFGSIIEVGADILHRDDPQRAAEVKEAWYAMTEYPRQALCDDFLPCLLTTDGLDVLIEAITREVVQSAIADIVRGKFPQLQQGLADGLPPADELLNAPLAPSANPTCNLDILWSQCLAIVTTVSQALIDFFEQLEVATNGVELAQATISAVPILGALADTVGADGWIGLVNYFQEALAEGFIAGYTETPSGTRDSLACALFCLCRDDCTITINRFFTATLQMFGEAVPPDILSSLQAAAEWITGISLFSAESSYYATMFVSALIAKAGSAFLPSLTRGTLDIILALASDEPSNDWQMLCDCAPVTETFSWGIARWRVAGGVWNDVTYSTSANGIPCGAISLPIGVTVELIAISGVEAMGIGWRDIWPAPPRPNVKVSGWSSASPYYFTSAFALGAPPDGTALAEAGNLGDTSVTFTFEGLA